MKYGENFERESVPEWSLHNIDYNYLKHFIKANTTRDEAKAIAIPGQPDTHLAKVEDELYNELSAQHDRAGLFVSAKADEITRRLQHLSQQVQRLISRCATDDAEEISIKQRRRFRKLEREVLSCGDDIQGLQRFVNAQVTAFRKILKKYRKWTGSTTMGSHFKDDVLARPKSFTHKDFQPLGQAYEELLATIRDSAPVRRPPQSPPVNDEETVSEQSGGARQNLRRVTIHPGPPQTNIFQPEQIRYWNEYDNGSENGDVGDEYVIYINPDEEADYGADLKSLLNTITAPFSKARSWVKVHRRERQSLLSEPSSASTYGATDEAASPRNGSYFTLPPGRGTYGRGKYYSASSDTDGDDDASRDPGDAGYASSVEFPSGYETHYATLPSIEEQRMALYKDRLVFIVTGGLFAMSFLILGIATVLMFTGRHRLRVEVDAAVTVGSVVSLGCACTALALTMARWDYLGIGSRAVVAVTFPIVCIANGMLLVLVMGNTTL
ncbi:hypothetical protein VPNG_06508 [Cytospora leucostoma]|uniref:SPX domain-containing protein n=1 Tax=Cytospora leucostoma TaxID=1230097 RepID=A0A423X271_9PEZI|nr:hypothetical protein VPNG_06508 [Cytospora leucostoma]